MRSFDPRFISHIIFISATMLGCMPLYQEKGYDSQADYELSKAVPNSTPFVIRSLRSDGIKSKQDYDNVVAEMRSINYTDDIRLYTISTYLEDKKNASKNGVSVITQRDNRLTQEVKVKQEREAKELKDKQARIAKESPLPAPAALEVGKVYGSPIHSKCPSNIVCVPQVQYKKLCEQSRGLTVGSVQNLGFMNQEHTQILRNGGHSWRKQGYVDGLCLYDVDIKGTIKGDSYSGSYTIVATKFIYSPDKQVLVDEFRIETPMFKRFGLY